MSTVKSLNEPITVYEYCGECNCEISYKFSSEKAVKNFKCKKCGTVLRACSLCETTMSNRGHCGDTPDGGCTYMDAKGHIRDKDTIEQLLKEQIFEDNL